MRTPLAFLLACLLLPACTPQRPAAGELAGTYATQIGVCALRLTLSSQMDYLYEKHCPAGQGDSLSHHGRWAPGPPDADPAVKLYGFQPGLAAAVPAQPDGFWSAAVVRGGFGFGAPRLCLDLERSYCLSR